MTHSLSPDQLAELSTPQRLSVEAYVERLTHQAAQTELRPKPGEAQLTYGNRKNITLGGLNMRNLIHEGHNRFHLC